jgi:NADH-quinone oxidoreductase subunit D
VLVSTETHATPGASDADADATEGRVYNAAGGDWDELITNDDDRGSNEQIVVNMGPQHPSTHGVLRLVLTLEGETVTDARASVGYLHTGIEKSMEYRTWTQGTTFITRADYLMPLYNEVAYCLAVERLLGIEDKLPERAKLIRVLLLELNRISSHLGGIGPFGMELGATTIFLHGLRMREYILDIFEAVTGLRMNHAFIRPGGVAQDLPPGALEQIRDFLRKSTGWVHDLRTLIDANPVFSARTKGVAFLDLEGCMALGITGPMLRATGLPWDLRKSQPYLDYETYDFTVPTTDTCDAYGRYIVRIEEVEQSLLLVKQVLDRLADRAGVPNDPWMIFLWYRRRPILRA